MRAALLALVLVASSASAQGFGGTFPYGGGTSSGSSPAPDPARDDVAASYTATGPNGVRTTPQVNPAALGTCAALAGAWAATTPGYESQVTGYFCNGSRWARVWTDEDGVTASPDRTLPARTFVSQAPAGDYSFKSNNNACVDFGDGVNDEICSLGSRLRVPSLQALSGQSFAVDVLTQSTLNADLSVSLMRWLRIMPSANAPCSTGNSGGIQARSSDGNRLWHCDGTTAYRIPRVAGPVTSSVTIPAMSPGVEETLNVTVAGVASLDVVWPTLNCDIPDVGIRRFRVSAADTVSVVIANNSSSTSTAETPCVVSIGAMK